MVRLSLLGDMLRSWGLVLLGAGEMQNIAKKITREFLLFSLASVAILVQAQTPQAERYPWDVRPAKCGLPDAAGSDICKANDWPSYEVTVERLDMLNSMGRYALLERALTELTASKELFPNGENKAKAVLEVIEHRADEHQHWRGGNSPLDRWRALFPQSDFVLLADSMLLDQPETEQKLMSAPQSLKATTVWQLAQQRLNSGNWRIQAKPQVERYPWDMRPPKCALKGADELFMCKANDWPTEETTANRLRSLRQSGQFALLERALGELATSEELFPDGESKASDVFNILEEIVNEHQQWHRPGKSPLTAWRAAYPSSGFILLADAVMLRSAAWAARGTGAASTVSPESWELFALRNREAEQTLLSAPQAQREVAVWYLILLYIELDNRQGEVSANTVFSNAVKRWPRNISFYRAIVLRLTPRWGGSWADVEAFISHSSQQLEATEGASFYARLYVWNGDQLLQGQSAMNWGKMRKGFDDWIARYPNVMAKNLYASYACFAQDKSSFGKAISQLPKNEIDPTKWLAGYKYEACFRWAGI